MVTSVSLGGNNYVTAGNILWRISSFAGKGGITVQFDFSIPAPKKEKLVRTISNGNDLNRAKLLTLDTQLLKNTRPNSTYYALFDDISHPISNMNDIQTIFSENTNDKIVPLKFSEVQKDNSVISNVL